jgi:shikimate dehydrogenase
VLDALSADPGFRGANVTIPHKEAAFRLLPEADAFARAVGAVNVISRHGNGTAGLVGHNTDAQGFLGALAALGFEPGGAACIVLGAGGAARACVAALASAGARSVHVVSRRPAQARELARGLRGFLESNALECSLDANCWPELDGLLVSWADAGDDGGGSETGRALVNATPAGMWPDGLASPVSAEQLRAVPPGTLVYDLIYNPAETRLVKMAKSAGLPSSGGGEMLVLQGAAALSHWVSGPVEPEVVRAMRAALNTVLEESRC